MVAVCFLYTFLVLFVEVFALLESTFLFDYFLGGDILRLLRIIHLLRCHQFFLNLLSFLRLSAVSFIVAR